MEAYCVKCREKREMTEAEATFTATGIPATRGKCPVCGTSMFRMGGTPAHEGMPRPDPKPVRRSKRRRSKRRQPAKKGNLVIVESPAKARTIGRYLGGKHRVRASGGHVRDLLRSKLSVDLENEYEPTYRIPNDKRPLVKELREEVARSEAVYLATDPDREGEAIAWHLVAAADIPENSAYRVVFNEVTQEAVTTAFDNPRSIDMDRVNAQQARRILDRLVGYQISPLLWSRVRGRLSAGRVQTVAVRLIVEREREIEAFDPEEYWTIEAELGPGKATPDEWTLTAALHRVEGQKAEIASENDALRIVSVLESAAWHVAQIRRRERRRKPPAPFTTSTLQQVASRRLGYSARKTMRIAQQLYEGVEVGDGEPVGLITYMRTDSVNVAASARDEVASVIAETFGPEYLPEEPTKHKGRAPRAQEAHEAIRPTSVRRAPSDLKAQLSRDQYRLYELVWSRFVASQMSPSIQETTSVDIGVGPTDTEPADRPYLFRASGLIVRFDGFARVWGTSESDRLLPELVEGQALEAKAVVPEQHFTQPPPRYSEASLVRAMEEHGIGRPSTYAPILSTIQQRGYVTLDERRFYPTELGLIVNDLLLQYFSDIFNVGFTAQMEDALDEVARGEREWVPVLEEFYSPFSEDLERAEREMDTVEIADEEIGEDCPECGAPLIVRFGRYGKFVGCSAFPDCRHTRPFQELVGVGCPECDGEIVVKRTRRGRTFYGCTNYPECEFASWKRPLPTPCPECGGMLTVSGRNGAQCTSCSARFDQDDLAADEPEGATPPASGGNSGSQLNARLNRGT